MLLFNCESNNSSETEHLLFNKHSIVPWQLDADTPPVCLRQEEDTSLCYTNKFITILLRMHDQI